MSTIKADNIATLAGVSTSMANAVNGSAKAWVVFNGTGTLSVSSSYGVSSVTDSGTGRYTVNFNSGIFTTNPAVTVAHNLAASGGYYNDVSISTLSTTSVQILNWRQGFTGEVDTSINCVVAHGS